MIAPSSAESSHCSSRAIKFRRFIDPFSDAFNRCLTHHCFQEIKETSADSQLAEAILYCLGSGGKRLRPALLYMCAGLAEDEIPVHVHSRSVFWRLALAIEFFHTYSLVHDDLPSMDNADTRRNFPSCHKKYSEWLATLVGDALNTMAFQQLARLANIHPTELANLPQYLDVLSSLGSVEGLIAGQAQDLTAQKKGSKAHAPVPTERSSTHAAATAMSIDQNGRPDFLIWQNMPRHQKKRIYKLKTGSLFACTCMYGAIMSGKSTDQKIVQSFLDFGYHFGYFYQRINDLLDWPTGLQNQKLGKENLQNLSREKQKLFRLGKCLQKESRNLELPKASRELLCQMITYLLP